MSRPPRPRGRVAGEARSVHYRFCLPDPAHPGALIQDIFREEPMDKLLRSALADAGIRAIAERFPPPACLRSIEDEGHYMIYSYSEGPIVCVETSEIGTGNAPEFRRPTNCFASCGVKLPEI